MWAGNCVQKKIFLKEDVRMYQKFKTEMDAGEREFCVK